MAATVRQLKAGHVLFMDGDVSQSIFIVKRGAISIRKKKLDQTFVEIAKIVSGGVIGEMSFFDGKPRSATAVASNDAEVIEITFEDMEDIYKNIPDYIKTIVSSLAERLRTANQAIIHLQKQLETKNKT